MRTEILREVSIFVHALSVIMQNYFRTCNKQYSCNSNTKIKIAMMMMIIKEREGMDFWVFYFTLLTFISSAQSDLSHTNSTVSWFTRVFQ